MVDTSQKARAIAMATLVAHCAAILGAAGLDAGTALLVAESLVDAEAKGSRHMAWLGCVSMQLD